MSRKPENSIKSRVDDLRNWTSLFVAETMDGTLSGPLIRKYNLIESTLEGYFY